MSERRKVSSFLQKFETRSEENGDMYISGYFSVFNSPYEMWKDVTEMISPGAFSNTLGDDIRCLVDHDTKVVLGRTKAGTLKLKQDKKGLWGEVKINPNDQEAVNVYERVKRGDIDQCSFGFDILDEEFVSDGSDGGKWIIKDVKLYEVSIVTFPAYEETYVNARKKDFYSVKNNEVRSWKKDLLKKLGR